MTAYGHWRTNLPSVDSVYQMANYNHHNHSYIIIIIFILFKDGALYKHQKKHMYNSSKLSTKTEQAKYAEENGHNEVTICFAQFFFLHLEKPKWAFQLHLRIAFICDATTASLEAEKI